MTIEDEIRDAMKYGASSMFLIGLLTYFQKDPKAAIKAIDAAGESIRLEREVKLSKAEAHFQSRPARLKSWL